MWGWIAGGVAAVVLVLWLSGAFTKKKTVEIPSTPAIVQIG